MALSATSSARPAIGSGRAKVIGSRSNPLPGTIPPMGTISAQAVSTP